MTASTQMPTPHHQAQFTALVVDDVLLDRIFSAVALRQLGYRVVQAVEGEEALRRLEQETYHLVCLDWNLPGLSGAETARRILQRPSPPAIIAITSDESADTRDCCLELGVAGPLPKGFTTEQLSAVLGQIMPVASLSHATTSARNDASQATRRLLLGRSQEQFAAERAKLGQAMRDGRRETALRALHNLMSLSGMVGALSIHEASRKLADELRLGRPIHATLAALDASLGLSRPATNEKRPISGLSTT